MNYKSKKTFHNRRKDKTTPYPFNSSTPSPHPPVLPFLRRRAERSGAHREAPRVCAQRAGVVQLRARPAAAAAASARQGRRLRRRLQLVEAGGADCSGACNSREAGERPAAVAAAGAWRGCGLRVEGAVQGRVEGAV